MLLTRYGRREWGGAALLAAGCSLALLLLPWWSLIVFLWVAWICVALFFRDPVRRVPEGTRPEVFVSPADGVIKAIEKLDKHEATGGQPALCIRIFLSVLDVHLNRAPCDAVVRETIHRPGQYLDARTEASAKVNESNLIVMERANELFGVRQVSGAIARRIVCAVEADQEVQRGERIGMIKFGSTTELILPRPEHVKPMVKVGDRVYAGESRVAVLSLGYRVDQDDEHDDTLQAVQPRVSAVRPLDGDEDDSPINLSDAPEERKF
ncbi:MAG: phosphatidylserine decarboxylase family protein [Planctomycetes bacterium]|nr:phosphatidylserine decarboxylase family protein [Planctomycetota bacterium]NOG53075.1 phosphatidylserine decarboxylase family protein [Planctomycetota bacterium]